MISQQNTSNPIIESGLINSNLKLSEETLKVIQEFLTVIQSESILTEGLKMYASQALSKVLYSNYIKYYEVYRNRVCDEDLDIYEKLVNFICMSNCIEVDKKELARLTGNVPVPFGVTGVDFNVNVGVEYRFLSGDKSYVGVYCRDSFPKSLSSAYTSLVNKNEILNIGKKINEGSYLRIRFMFNVDSLDEVRLFIEDVFKNPLFKKWQFKGICSDEEIIKIKYIYKIQDKLYWFYRREGLNADNVIKSMNPTTYKCMDIIKHMMYSTNGDDFRFAKEKFLYRKVRDMLIDICLQYFVPENDKELFCKLLRYVTCANNSYAMMGYSGVAEKSIEKVDKILEKRLEMLRLIDRTVYNVSESREDKFKYFNAFRTEKFLGIKNLDDIDKVVEIIANLESYKNFDIEKSELDKKYLSKVNDKSVFEDIGLSEETVYLAIIAIKVLYRVPKIDLRSKMREEILEGAKNFINKDEYKLFREMVIRFTTEKDGKFIYLPPESMKVCVDVYMKKENYFKGDAYIRQYSRSSDVVLKVDTKKVPTVVRDNTNDRLSFVKDIENSILNGNAFKYVPSFNYSKCTQLVGIDECFIIARPEVYAFSGISEHGVRSGECLLRNVRIAELIKYALSI